MPSDPRCPDCNGRVGVSAQFCMHCGAEFERPVDGAAETRSDGVGTAATDASRAVTGNDAADADATTDDERVADNRDARAVPLQVAVLSGLFLGVFTIPVVRLVAPVLRSVFVGALVSFLATGFLLSRDSLAAVRRAVAGALVAVGGGYLVGSTVTGTGGPTVETLAIYAVGGLLVLSLSYRPEWWALEFS